MLFLMHCIFPRQGLCFRNSPSHPVSTDAVREGWSVGTATAYMLSGSDMHWLSCRGPSVNSAAVGGSKAVARQANRVPLAENVRT